MIILVLILFLFFNGFIVALWRGETPNLCKVMDKYHKAQTICAEKGNYLIGAAAASYRSRDLISLQFFLIPDIIVPVL